MGHLVLPAQQCSLCTLDSLDIPFLNILGVLLGFNRDPWVWEYCPSTWGHLMSSTASVEGGIAPFDHHTNCSHNRMVDSVWCLGMDSAVHGLSIGQYYRSSGGLGLLLWLFV